MKEFLFGHGDTLDVIGWHIALVIVFATGLWIGHKHQEW